MSSRNAGRPRDRDLPGMEDHGIPALEEVAAAYADVRDRRMALTEEEADLKQTALALMRQYDKTVYRHEGIEIRIVAGEDDVKVKIRKAPHEENDDPDEEVAIS
jgi:hypothetical protein